jgi:hypothetical protein
MKPVVIQLERKGKWVYADLREAPAKIVRSPGSASRVLDLDPNTKPYSDLNGPKLQPGIVQACGAALTERMECIEEIHSVFDRIAAAKADDEFPILLQLDDAKLESLPWETIWREPMKFFSLNPVAPVARIPTYINNELSSERAIEPKLRVLAVLSAAGVTPGGEWNSLYDALKQYGHRVHIKVILSEPALQRQIAGLNDPSITFDWLHDSPGSLVNAIKIFAPNVLHFFCHGTSEIPKLDLFTRTGEPIELTSADLSTIASMKSLWLLTLNACKSAQSSTRFYSMARELLDCGVGAVVAMKERIDWGDANLFSRGFYASVIPDLIRLLPADTSDHAPRNLPESVLLQGVRMGRQALHRPDAPRRPDDSTEWTLPVLYLRRPFLTLIPRPETSVDVSPIVNASPITAEIITLRQVLSDMERRSVPADLQRQIREHISNLEAQVGNGAAPGE